MQDLFLARQPIFDREGQVRGYEVLFRSGTENRAIISNANQATSQVLLNTFVGIGLERVVGDRLAFVNIPADFLTGKHALPMSPERLVLEILEDVPINDELIAGVCRLIEQGYTLALDDVTFDERLLPLLQLAKIIKVELPKLPRDRWGEHLAEFRRFPVEVLAEKVETQEDFDYCRELGFDLFQGYFFARPQMLTAKQPSSDQMVVLQLLGQLNQPDVSIDDIERTLKSDVSLSYSVLRYVNSASSGQRRQVDSLKQAIAILGLRGVRTLVMLVTLSGFASGRSETLRTAILRALMCENLGKRQRGCDPGACFTAGLISMLDAVLGLQISEVLRLLPLSDDVRLAITEGAGPIGAALKCAIAYGQVDGGEVVCQGLSNTEIRDAYFDAIGELERLWSGLN